MNTSRALSARVSASSCGSAPIPARDVSQRSRKRPMRRRTVLVGALRFGAVGPSTASYVEALARLSLFADLPHPQLEALAHSFDEEAFAEGQRVIRQDVTGGG